MIAAVQDRNLSTATAQCSRDRDGAWGEAGHLLEAHTRVLRLIAGDADLADCLAEIAIRLKALTGGAEAVVVAMDPGTGEIVSAASTATALEPDLSASTSSRDGGQSEGFEGIITAHGLKVGARHDVRNRHGQTLGAMMILADRSSTTTSP
ncbi:MAG: hypothetical protein OEU92_09535, partial [Alphaproteobacteria bacterium]|nr:hypothetical protein [Alphaproteobacteria bacterium]